jgi:hypothetical protein
MAIGPARPRARRPSACSLSALRLDFDASPQGGSVDRQASPWHPTTVLSQDRVAIQKIMFFVWLE